MLDHRGSLFILNCFGEHLITHKASIASKLGQAVMWRLIMGKSHELPAIGAMRFSFSVRPKGAHRRQFGSEGAKMFRHLKDTCTPGEHLSVRYQTQPLAPLAPLALHALSKCGSKRARSIATNPAVARSAGCAGSPGHRIPRWPC
jgi:hypothetical protein